MSDSFIDNQACPGRVETIQLWLDGELLVSEREAFEGHLATCQQCQTHLAELETIYVELATLTEVVTPDDLVDQVMANLPTRTLPSMRSPEMKGRPLFLGQLALAIQIGVGLALLLLATWTITPNFDQQFLWLPWLTISEMAFSVSNWLTDLTGYIDLWAQKWSPTMEVVRLDISPTLAVMLVAGLGLAWLAGNTLLLTTRQSTPKNGGI